MLDSDPSSKFLGMPMLFVGTYSYTSYQGMNCKLVNSSKSRECIFWA